MADSSFSPSTDRSFLPFDNSLSTYDYHSYTNVNDFDYNNALQILKDERIVKENDNDIEKI